MSFVIRGIGTATPEHFIAQSDAAELAAKLSCQTAKQKNVLPVLYQQSGVKRRYSVLLEASNNGRPAAQSFYQPLSEENRFGPNTSQRMQRYQTESVPLAVQASRAALHDSGLSSDKVTHLITVSCTGFHAPGFDIALMRELSLNAGVARTHIGFMGCHGALNALRVAQSFAKEDPTACVLLCAVELCSLHQQYGWNPQQIVANALFADGAAAVIGTSEQHATAAQGVGRPMQHPAGWCLYDNGSTVIPESESMMSWHIGDHGFEMSLSPLLPDLIRRRLGDWLNMWLGRHGMRRDDVSAWAIHPGGPRILKAVAEAAGLDDLQLQASQTVLAEFGNMSSATILFILQRLKQSHHAPLPCVALGFGPGVTIEAALFVEAPHGCSTR